MRERQTDRQTETQKEEKVLKTWDKRERERENSNSKTLFYKDFSLGSVRIPV